MSLVRLGAGDQTVLLPSVHGTRWIAEYDQMEGIAWRWQCIDGAMLKAPLAQEAVGRNPTDRGKKGEQAPPAGGRAWRPVVARGDRSECA